MRLRPLLTLTLAVALAPVVVGAPAVAGSGATCLGRRATITGTSGPDRIVGTPGPDVIVGLGGQRRDRRGDGS